MSDNFFKRFNIKFHWTYSELVLKVIQYLTSVPCNYKIKRSYNNYYEITVEFETEEEFEPVQAMIPEDFGIIIYR